MADSVLLKVFFRRWATNHQGGTAFTPNWYHYWTQTNAVYLAPQDYGDYRCTWRKAGFYYPGELKFHICDSAAVAAYSLCKQAIMDGIDNFAVTERHEGQHRNDWLTFWPWPIGYIQSDDMDPPTPGAPPNWPPVGDYVPDNLEGTLQYPDFRPTAQDSDGDWYYDFDDLGYDAECNWTTGAADTADWSNPGHQY